MSTSVSTSVDYIYVYICRLHLCLCLLSVCVCICRSVNLSEVMCCVVCSLAERRILERASEHSSTDLATHTDQTLDSALLKPEVIVTKPSHLPDPTHCSLPLFSLAPPPHPVMLPNSPV